ncbi:glycine/sarcosine/betaine reductase selenoprotein B family protein [Castellaniella sp. WN]
MNAKAQPKSVVQDIGDDLGFAPAWDAPVRYMERTEAWYLALGYNNPYQWAHYEDVPFTPPGKPLNRMRIALITTAAPYQPGKGDQGPGAPYNALAKFYKVYSAVTDGNPDMRISHVGIDRQHTTAEDLNTYFPLQALKRLRDEGVIGGITEHFHGIPTNRSQRHTVEADCPDVLARCLKDGADAVILVPNCPICHQSVSLTARYLERHGIPTVVMGVAKDIVEHVGVPRLCFSDFPLGNSVGRPHDPASQESTLRLALRLLEAAPGPRTTVQNPLRWIEPTEWRLDYCNPERRSPEELKKLRAEVDEEKRVAKEVREATYGCAAHG